MGYQIIKQPNGQLCLWSSISTSIIMYDCTPEDIIEHMVKQEHERIKGMVGSVVKQLEEGGRPYFQFTMDWSQAINEMEEAHGIEAVGEILDNMDRLRPPDECQDNCNEHDRED